jgi:hypothetical protein
MMPPRPSAPADHRGPLAVDALLEACRPLSALSPVVHTRVKQRLSKNLASWNGPHTRWLKTAVVTVVLLLGGGASGLVLDRLVFRHSSTSDVRAGSSAPAGGRARLGKASSHRAPPPTPVPLEAAVPAAAAERLEASPGPASSALVEGRPLLVPMRVPGRRLAMPLPKIPTDDRRPLASGEHAPTALQPLVMPSAASPARAPATVAILAPPTEPVAAPALAPARVTMSSLRPDTVPSQPNPQTGGPWEERMLAAAVRALRSQNDAPSALTTLDEYRARYPRGRLSVEADALRASALLALDRRDEALHTLDGIELARLPGGSERQLQRAELRAWAGRQQEAITDFDAVLGRVGDGGLAERALWGRAQARLASGDGMGAQRDAVLYLQRHPTGQFAGPAARLAGASP